MTEWKSKINDPEIIKKALECYQERNAPITKDNKNPQQILHTYMMVHGHEYDTVQDEIDWQYFESGSKIEDVFGSFEMNYKDE